jgi:tripartite-type tricarboxylate transporter receptor subunit TctC
LSSTDIVSCEEEQMKRALLLAAAILIAVVAPGAFSQKYPSRPIRLVAPFPPGGGVDILSRIITVPVSESLGQTVVVDNRPGAGGAIGADIAAHAEPDGYTLVMVSSSYAATSAYHKPSYDPINGIQPIILIGTTGLVVSVNPSVPVKSVTELIAYARANPGKLNYGSVGPGSVAHLTLELFKQMAHVNVVHVPYKGGGPALSALVAGEAHFGCISLVPTLPHVKAKRLRAIGITTSKRSNLLPDVPAIGEALPGFEVVHWYGMWGPKGLPRDIVTRWNREVAKVLLSDKMKRQMRNEGLEPGGGPPEQFMKVLRPAVEKWQKVVREAKLDQQPS